MNKLSFKKTILAAGIVMALSPNVLLADEADAASAIVNTTAPTATEEVPTTVTPSAPTTPQPKKTKKKKAVKKKSKSSSNNSDTMLQDTPDPIDLNSD